MKRYSNISNISEMLDLKRDMDENINRYFCFDSQLFKAIKEHIARPRWSGLAGSRERDCVLIDLEDQVPVYTATGPSISFRKAHKYSDDYSVKPPKVSEYYSLTIEVEYANGEDNAGPPRYKTYSIDVPLSLELNYTQEAFDAWIASLRAKRDTKQKTKDLANLEALIAKYPGVASKLLGKGEV